MTDFLRVLAQGLREIGLDYREENLIKSQDYHDLLLYWNQKINLTAIEDSSEMAIKHFIDSLIPLMHVKINKDDRLIDVGTGAGFPGVPLKIFVPGLRLSLLDSLAKRCRFLSELVSCLKLEHVEVMHGRAEDKAREKNYRENFDLVTARAVTSLPVLAEYCLPFIKVGGCFFALKGGDLKDELEMGAKAVKTLGGEVTEVKTYQLPLIGDARSLVIIGKIAPTPEKYPRKAGIPAKKPLV